MNSLSLKLLLTIHLDPNLTSCHITLGHQNGIKLNPGDIGVIQFPEPRFFPLLLNATISTESSVHLKKNPQGGIYGSPGKGK